MENHVAMYNTFEIFIESDTAQKAFNNKREREKAFVEIYVYGVVPSGFGRLEGGRRG